MLPRSRALGAGGTPRFCPSTSLAMPERQKRAGTPCNRRRRRAAMPPGWRVRHAHGASSEGSRADIRAVCIVPRHGARRGAPVRRAAQPRGRRAGARPGAAGRRWAPAFASRCQAPGPSPGARGGCVRSRVGAARCSCSPLHAFSAASARLASAAAQPCGEPGRGRTRPRRVPRSWDVRRRVRRATGDALSCIVRARGVLLRHMRGVACATPLGVLQRACKSAQSRCSPLRPALARGRRLVLSRLLAG